MSQNQDRDRDEAGRARQARPRDELGRPLPYGETGVEPQPHLYLGSYVEYVARTGHEAPGVHA